MQCQFPSKMPEQCKDIFAFFTDYENAFDRVTHTKLMEILQQKQLFLLERHTHTESVLGSASHGQDWLNEKSKIKLEEGFHQEFILSLQLFNIHFDNIFKEAFHDTELGTQV